MVPEPSVLYLVYLITDVTCFGTDGAGFSGEDSAEPTCRSEQEGLVTFSRRCCVNPMLAKSGKCCPFSVAHIELQYGLLLTVLAGAVIDPYLLCLQVGCQPAPSRIWGNLQMEIERPVSQDSAAANQLRIFVERIERLFEE